MLDLLSNAPPCLILPVKPLHHMPPPQYARRASERQAILAASAPVASTPQGEVHRLQAELDASRAQVAQLEADAAAQSAAAAAKLNELQGAYAAKVGASCSAGWA